MIAVWVHGYYSLKGDVRILKHDINNVSLRQGFLDEHFSQLTSVLQTLAVQEERFKGVEHRTSSNEQDIRDLQNGIGYNTERISGEYGRHGKINKT